MENNTIEKGDLVFCLGVGYPHWLNHIFLVNDIFPCGDLGLSIHIRVGSVDFKKYTANEEVTEYIKKRHKRKWISLSI